MYPDVIRVLPDNLCEAFCKNHVGSNIRLPKLRVEAPERVRRHGQHVVQQRPQLALAEALVEPLLELGLEIHWQALVSLQQLLRNSLHAFHRVVLEQHLDCIHLRES